jgi:hypothetical protein
MMTSLKEIFRMWYEVWSGLLGEANDFLLPVFFWTTFIALCIIFPLIPAVLLIIAFCGGRHSD